MPNGNARLTTHARALLVARQAHPYRCEETQPHPRQRRLASPRPIRDRKKLECETVSWGNWPPPRLTKASRPKLSQGGAR